MKALLIVPFVALMLMGCTADIYHTNGAPAHPDRDLGFAFRVFVVDDTQNEDTLEAYAGVDLPEFITEE